MSRREIITKIAQDIGISKVAAEAALESVLHGVTKALKSGKRVTFVGFGTFSIRTRRARVGRHPQTGTRIRIPKRRVVRFTPGAKLKRSLV